MNATLLTHFGVQFITHFTERYSYMDSARIALDGGCKWIQLRMKDAPPDEVARTAHEVQAMCRAYGATFLIDDHVALCRQGLSDGVHVGKHDMPVNQARALLGEKPVIGGTANTFEDVCRHYRAGATYIGCGPYRFTTTKKNLSPVLGVEGYRLIVGQMEAAGIRIPMVAIGGIAYDDIPPILATGVQGIALSGSILRADNPVEEMRRIVERVSSIRGRV